MSQQQSPFLEGKYGWNFGESGWNFGMDENILKFSFMFDRNVDGIVSSLPPAINGNSYFLTTDNRLYFAVATTWYSCPVPKWFEFKIRDSGDTYQFDGSSAILVDSPANVDARLDAVELTLESLGSAAFQSSEYFATQTDLAITEENSQVYTDNLRTDLASGGATTGANQVVFIQPDAGAQPRTLGNRAQDVVNVLDFIPAALHASIKDNSNSVDLQPYIQAALDAARGPGVITRQKLRRVFIPSGFYLTSTIYIPEGVILQGNGTCETTAGNATRLIQYANGDVIRFAGHFSGDRWWWFGRLQDFVVYGSLDRTAGYGIHFAEADGSQITPQDTTCIRDVIVRFCKQGGIRFPKGGLPMDLSTVKIKDCEGPGVSITGGVGSIQSFILYQPSIDRCGTEGILIENHDNRGNIILISPKFEGGLNPDVNVNAIRQRVAIRVRNCDNGAPIQIVGATHIMAAADAEKPGDFIVVEGSGVPHLEWSNVQVRIADGQVGPDPKVVSHSAESVAVPYTVKTGSLSNLVSVDRSTSSTRRHVLGNADDYRAPSVEGTAYQVAGLTPAYSLFETDGSADAKQWLMVASGGSLTFRSVSDAGVAIAWMQAQRTAGSVTRIDWSTPQRPGVYTKATLPTAANQSNTITMISDPTAGKGRLVYSDGSNWKYVSDDTVV